MVRKFRIRNDLRDCVCANYAVHFSPGLIRVEIRELTDSVPVVQLLYL